MANTQSVSPELDYFENVEATQKELPTIVQLYRFALRIKQHKELILQEYRALALDLQANFSDVGQLSKEGVVDRVPFAGTPASIRAMFEDTVKALFQDKLTLIEAQFPQDKTSQNEKRENYSKKTAVFEKLKNLFPQPVFPEIKIADKPISPDAQKQYEKVLADYQANCQAVEKIYSVALMLHRKWPTQFNLDLVLDKIQKLSPRLTAYEFGSMLSVIQGIDAVYLPSELFTLFDSKNFPQCISVVVDVMEFHHVSLQDKIRIAQAVLQSPNNAPAVYFLPTLLENYKDKPQLCEGISDLFFKNINQ